METPRPDVASGDEPLPSSMCRLLGTGMTMRLPQLEESGPVTGDMLRQQGLGQAAAYRGREVLLADMKAFRAANDGRGGGGAVFADFVRWYRPECWQVRGGSEAFRAGQHKNATNNRIAMARGARNDDSASQNRAATTDAARLGTHTLVHHPVLGLVPPCRCLSRPCALLAMPGA
ncbi:unnamed protein product [Scytosiphon promiscuus]